MASYAFAGIVESNKKLCIAISGDKSFEQCQLISPQTDTVSSILSWLTNFEKKHYVKILGAGVSDSIWEDIFSRLWLELDIVPIQQAVEQDIEQSAKDAATAVEYMFNEDGSFPAQINNDRSVKTYPLVRLSDYEAITPQADFKKLLKLAEKLKGKKIVYVSATPQGGGVALMRHSLVRLAKMLDLNIQWLVLKDDPNVFEITKKKFHNILQNVAKEGEMLTDSEKDIFSLWSLHNYDVLKDQLNSADYVVIDDPQPSGLIPHIKNNNPKTKIIYRSHINLVAELADQPGTPQHVTWAFIEQFVEDADAFITHPIDEFIPYIAKQMKLYKMGASTDPLDGLNKELNEHQLSIYTNQVNKYLEKSGQKSLDPTRNYITQIARFDPSKGIPDVLLSYKKLVKKLKNDKSSIPQLVIAGHGSIDDPDGAPLFDATRMMLATDDYKDLADDVKVARLPHSDQLLNTILRKSIIALQLSHKEGFEVKVSEALLMGKPVIVYNTGGIPLQVENGKNGYIVNNGDTDRVAEKLYALLVDSNTYSNMSQYAKKHVPINVLTIGKSIEWFEVFLGV